MTNTFKKLEDGALELLITVPWAEIEKTYNEAVEDAVKEAEVSGFRKGKAPRAVVEKSLDKSKTYEEVVRRVVPKAYSDAVSEQKLHPVIMPKIELVEATEKKDWVIKAITCEKPTITINDYKVKISELKKAKLNKIWVPGQKPDETKAAEAKKPTLDEILNTVFESVTVQIPAILIENETNRLLSDLIDQTKKIGLTVDQYLASSHKTADSIRAEYAEDAKRTITLEFTLEEIADKEGILISDDDIDNAISQAKSEEERQALQKERYYLASILRRQKTVDFLAAL
jgi:FKBP-type peptidyl-prolyl cis-trans isomerase (trigger factor)